MSAPKKNQKTEVAMTERQRQEAKEAKSVKVMTFTFVTAIILCLAIFVVSVASAPVMSVITRNTDAATVGDHTLSAVELNYFYIDAISSYYSNYSSYISYILDVTKPLDKQTANSETKQTWADYFLDMAIENAKSTYALYDEAMAKGFKLTEEEQTSLDSMIKNMDTNIKYYAEIYAQLGYSYPYNSAADYLKGLYGNGASTKTYHAYYSVCYIADAYMSAYNDSLEYDEEAIRAYEKDITSNYNSYTYNYYLLKAESYYQGGTEDEKGTITYSEEEKQAAREVVRQLAEKIAAGECEGTDKFNDVINAVLEEYQIGKETTTEYKQVSSTPAKDSLGTKVNTLFIEWLSEEGRTAGDMTVIEYATGEGDDKVINGYYVLCYGSTNENTFALANVRHILVKFEGGKTDSTTGVTTYTDAEKEAAKAAAQALLDEWLADGATEDAFAKLANDESDDGDGTTGGLYEDIYPGQMVTNFNDWCFEEGRQVGDYGLVETEYGYHVMYFSSFSDINYRDFLITNDMRNADLTAWHEALVKAITFTTLNDKYVDKGITMNEVSGS